MANQFLDAQEYSNVMLLLLKNQLVYGKLVDGQFKNEVSDENGLTINVKRPPHFLDKKNMGAANPAALDEQDIVSGSMPISVNQYSKVHVSVGDIEYVESFNSLMANSTMKSAASALAHSIDGYIADQTKLFHSWVAGGDPANGAQPAYDATDPTVGIGSQIEALAGHTRLMSQGAPNDGMLSGVVNFVDGQKIRGSLQTSYNEPQLATTTLERVRIPMISEVDWYATQQLPLITAGSRAQGDNSSTGAQISGADQDVDYVDVAGAAGTGRSLTQTLAVSGGTGVTIKKGEVFTISGVYAYDWRAQQKLDYLQQFTVLEDVTTNATTGNASLSISPAIIAADSGVDANQAFASVNTAPADAAYIQFAGASGAEMPIRSVFHKRAIALVSARLQMPFTGTASFSVDPDTGIALRYWRGSDISTGRHIHRWDCLYGATVLDPFLGTRVCGTT